jgi:hypothetical protein
VSGVGKSDTRHRKPDTRHLIPTYAHAPICHPSIRPRSPRAGHVGDAEPCALSHGRRVRQPVAELSGRYLPRAGEYDDRQAATRAWSGGERLLLARSAARGDVDVLERLHFAAADLGRPARPRPLDYIGRVVPASQQRLWRRLHLHAGARAQRRWQRITLVLHAAGYALRRAAVEAGPLPAASFLGPDRRDSVDAVDRGIRHSRRT